MGIPNVGTGPDMRVYCGNKMRCQYEVNCRNEWRFGTRRSDTNTAARIWMVTEVAVLGGRREPLRQGTRRPEAVRKRAVAVPAVARGASKHGMGLDIPRCEVVVCPHI